MFREQAGFEILLDQVVLVVIGLQNDIAPATAITTDGTTLGDVGLTMEGDTALAAFAGAGEYFDLIDKHNGTNR